MSDSPIVDTDGPGIRELLERADGGQPTNLLQDDPPPAREQPTPQEDAESVADQLRRDSDAATARARQAERERDQERQARQRTDVELQRTRQSQYENEYNSVSGLLVEREEEAERLQAEHATAADAGDHKRMAQIAYRLGKIGAEVTNLQVAKSQFETDRGNQLRQPTPTPTPTPTQGEWTTVGVPREVFLNGDSARGILSRSEATKAFLREHDEFFTDPAVYNSVVGAHGIATGRGVPQPDGTFRKLTPDTPAYFRFIEEQAGMSGTRSRPRDSSSPPAAPPSRDATGPTGRNRGGDIHVTADEVRAAKWMMDKMPGGYTAEDAKQYAIEKAELNRRGDLPLRRR